jgi:hypothetical protein
MNTNAKTIQIYLPGGDPRGIRVAEITTQIVQVIEVPRSQIKAFLEMPELLENSPVAVYFLFGAGEDGQDQVYIGQTGNIRMRLNEHNAKKDFWQRALILVTTNRNFTQTHALFLEWYCLQEAAKAERYLCENGNAGSRPHTPAPLAADCAAIFEAGKILLSTLGYPLFEPVGRADPGTTKDLYYCKAVGSDARGLYTEDGFVVLKGSTGRAANVDSIVGTSAERFREKLIEIDVMKVEGEKVAFQKDHLFLSPSMAAIAVLGRTANGWKEWKNKDGKTLHEMKREIPTEGQDAP